MSGLHNPNDFLVPPGKSRWVHPHIIIHPVHLAALRSKKCDNFTADQAVGASYKNFGFIQATFFSCGSDTHQERSRGDRKDKKRSKGLDNCGHMEGLYQFHRIGPSRSARPIIISDNVYCNRS